jgi:hypothetical protein
LYREPVRLCKRGMNLCAGDLPAFITNEVLPSAPTVGNGVHRFLFDLACVLTPYRDEETISCVLQKYAERCGRRVLETEIRSTIRCASRYAWQSGPRPRARASTELILSERSARPEFDGNALRRFTAGQCVDGDWLERRSPICPWNRTPASFLNALFLPGEKVVIFDDFKSQGQALWTHPGLRYDAGALNAFARWKQFVGWFLANPVDGETRVNDEGKLSGRSHQNITAWRYLVIESDRNDVTSAQWLTTLAKLRLPTAAIYETGGRLPHARLRVGAPSKEQWDKLKDSLLPLLIEMDADKSSLSAVRLIRLPYCERVGKEDEHGNFVPYTDGPHFEQLLFLNPNPSTFPITDLSVWPDPPAC